MSVLEAPPRVQPQAPPAPQASHLGRAAGIELLGPVDGSGYKAGAALVRRADGQMVQLSTLLYELLDGIDGRRSLDELAALLSDRLGRRVETDHVVKLAEKLAAQGLLAGTEGAAPPKRNPLLALRWKVLITNPRVTGGLTWPFTGLFAPWILVPALLCFGATLWFVAVEKGIASATAQAFDRPGLLLLVTALVVASAGFHELGHAAACRYGGAKPGGIGAGLYLVWPAFYTDVTDAYRLPRRARLRVDLGGLYFNALVAIVTMGAWLLTGIDALLLLIALQLIEMVKQLSPVIRADGYHILSDLTGVPDLYRHIGPTLKELLPGRREPSALHGRARAIVTLWVLVVVPALAALAVTAILLLPRLAASAWASGRELGTAIPTQAGDADVLGVLTSALQLFALALPALGALLITVHVARAAVRRARAWSAGSAPRGVAAALAGIAAVGALAWAWWPDGQYRPVRGDEDWTVTGLVRAAAPGVAPAVAADEPPRLAPGRHLAVAMIPRGGATKERPALYVIRNRGKHPVAVVSTDAPAVPPSARASAAAPDSGAAASAAPPPSGELAPSPPSSTTSPAETSSSAAPAQESRTSAATAFPFKLPEEPKPGDTQAVAVGKADGKTTYDIAYAVVTVKDGSPVTQRNGAYALANCKACTTIAVSFQVVLVVGQSNLIAPVNVAQALNVGCPYCITAAFANQIVVSLTDDPTPELVERIQAALKRLDGLSSLESPAEVSTELADIRREINQALDDSGLRVSQQTSTEAAETQPPEPQTTEPAPPPGTTSEEPPPTTTSEQPPPATSGEPRPTTTSEQPPPTTSEDPPPTTTSEEPPPTTTSEAPPPTTTEEPPPEEQSTTTTSTTPSG